jgi:hypothetical protein
MQFIDAIYIWNALNLILFLMSFLVFILDDAFHIDFLFFVMHTFHIFVISFIKGITNQPSLVLLEIFGVK